MNATDFWGKVYINMGIMTEQERVLIQMRETYGKTAYTEHHMNYRLVGFNRGQRVFAIGDTWEQAIDRLARKAAA